MKEFSEIFKFSHPWEVQKNEDGFVTGIQGTGGNQTFETIKTSINQYLSKNNKSVIDFNLLKDAVDRNCDMVEEDINTLTPVPLYCGLAGTMVGVIIGLASLLFTGSISDLLGVQESEQEDTEWDLQSAEKQADVEEDDDTYKTEFRNAAHGVNDLLSGVAWAMMASICGLGLTTAGSLMFKRRKLEGDAGKNEFLAWMQSCLLPELPSDTTQVLNRLTKNLRSFNNVFAENTTKLEKTLRQVNAAYDTQAKVVEAIRDLDIKKVSMANVTVLKNLMECTDKLEDFQKYLDSVKGYTQHIKEFHDRLDAESDRLYVLQEIRDYFARHKQEIVKDMDEQTNYMKMALDYMQEATQSSLQTLRTSVTEETDKFNSANQQLVEAFAEKLQTVPKLMENLGTISQIPFQLQSLYDKIGEMSKTIAEQMGKQAAKNEEAMQRHIKSFMKQTASSAKKGLSPEVGTEAQEPIGEVTPQPTAASVLPNWLKILAAVALTILIVACGWNIYSNDRMYKALTEKTMEPAEETTSTAAGEETTAKATSEKPKAADASNATPAEPSVQTPTEIPVAPNATTVTAAPANKP